MKPKSEFEDIGCSAEAPPRKDGGSVALFLSLYLLLLAFFILLVSISQGNSPKTRLVLEGLSSQFASNTQVDTPTKFSADLGNFVSPAEYLDRVVTVYEAAIPATKVHVVSPGQIMEISFHINSLFEPGAETLRPAQRRVIGELVPTLLRPPPGLRYVVEVMFGLPKQQEQVYPVTEDQLMRRAGAVARAYIEQGALPHLVTVSMTPMAEPSRLHVLFRVETVAVQQGEAAQ